MIIKQIAVFMENKPGKIADITKLLADNSIDIRAVNIADTADFGILRMIVSNADKAEKVMRNHGMSVSITDVIAVLIDDRIGAFYDIISVLKSKEVNIEYLYSFIGEKTKAIIVIKTENINKCIEVLKANGVKVLSENELRGANDAK